MRKGFAALALAGMALAGCSHSSHPSTAQTVRIIDNALSACEHARMTDCHAEVDTDGSIGVYGTPTTTTEGR